MPTPGSGQKCHADLFTAFVQQLGLKLESTKAPVDVMVGHALACPDLKRRSLRTPCSAPKTIAVPGPTILKYTEPNQLMALTTGNRLGPMKSSRTSAPHASARTRTRARANPRVVSAVSIEYAIYDAIAHLHVSGASSLVSVILFGSASSGAFSESSDVDLILALPDAAATQDRRRLRQAVSALEITHGLRSPAALPKNPLEKFAEHAGGEAHSCFICSRSDLLSDALALLSVAAYPALPDATRYAMGALKHSLHSCYFCYHLKTAPIHQEVEFFNLRLGRSRSCWNCWTSGKVTTGHSPSRCAVCRTPSSAETAINLLSHGTRQKRTRLDLRSTPLPPHPYNTAHTAE